MVNRHVVTLANSIVGVSVLAMPFCFKQCGIVLATLSLFMGAIMTRMVCYFLLKAAVINRRRTYEMLAWSTFGQTGKFLVEISIIGFLIGTLIAFMVVIGDLGPEILSEMFSVENNPSLRTIIMTALSLFVALPLGLLRNIDSLGSVSTASVLFYLFLVIKIVLEGFGPLWSGEYLERIHFWRAGGVLQCIPIFSMALSCQTQIFGIYDSLAEPSVQKMNEVVKQSVYICTFFYFSVGFFGYIAFGLHPNFGGNILLSFSPAWSTQLIKSMFLMSVVFSVPLVVFPCRASLHSLMFKSGGAYHHVHDISTNYIPESRMKLLTVSIVAFTLIVGILIPNIELVLGLVGSTTGSVICIIFPSIMFVRVTSKNTTERLLAQFMFIVGVVLMLLTTYATLYAAEQTQMSEHIPDQLRVTDDIILKPIPQKDAQLNSPISKSNEERDKPSQFHRVEFEPKIPEKMISKDSLSKSERIASKANNNRVDFELKLSPPSSSTKKPSVVRININDETEEQKRQQQQQHRKEQLAASPESIKIDNRNLQNNEEQNHNKEKEDSKKSVQEERKENPIEHETKSVKNELNRNGDASGPSRQNQPNQYPPKEPVKQQPVKMAMPAPLLSQAQGESIEQKRVEDARKAPSASAPSQQASQDKVDQSSGQSPAEKTGEANAKKDFADPMAAEEILKRLEKQQEDQKKLIEEQKEILEELKQHHAQDVKEKNEQKRQKTLEAVKAKTDESKVVLNEAKKLLLDSENNRKPGGAGEKDNSDKLIKEQAKIIERLSESIKQESDNAELLKNLEEKLVKAEEAKEEVEDKKKDESSKQNEMVSDPSGGSISQADKMKGDNVPPVEENQKPIQNYENLQQDSNRKDNGEVFKGIDKEKGVLVGSLGASGTGFRGNVEPISSNNYKLASDMSKTMEKKPIEQDAEKDKRGTAVKNEKVKEQNEEHNIPPEKHQHNLLDVASPPSPLHSHQHGSPPEASKNKQSQPVSEDAPPQKKKIDREI